MKYCLDLYIYIFFWWLWLNFLEQIELPIANAVVCLPEHVLIMSWEKYITCKGVDTRQEKGGGESSPSALVSTAANLKEKTQKASSPSLPMSNWQQTINTITRFIMDKMGCCIMKQATLFHSQIVSSYWNSWQFVAGRWNQLIILNRGVLRSRYYPWQFVSLFIALSSCCYTERSMNLLFFFPFFSVIILNWNAILKWSKRWLFSIWQY